MKRFAVELMYTSVNECKREGEKRACKGVERFGGREWARKDAQVRKDVEMIGIFAQRAHIPATKKFRRQKSARFGGSAWWYVQMELRSNKHQKGWSEKVLLDIICTASISSRGGLS